MVGEVIKRLRLEKKLSLRALAQSADISKSTLSDIEKAHTSPTITTLKKIATALSVGVDLLLASETSVQIEMWEEPYNLGELVNESKSRYDCINKHKKIAPTLDIIPEEFINPVEARVYISKHKIFSSAGFDANKLSDAEVLEFGNALLEQMKMVSYKYKK